MLAGKRYGKRLKIPGQLFQAAGRHDRDRPGLVMEQPGHDKLAVGHIEFPDHLSQGFQPHPRVIMVE